MINDEKILKNKDYIYLTFYVKIYFYHLNITKQVLF